MVTTRASVEPKSVPSGENIPLSTADEQAVITGITSGPRSQSQSSQTNRRFPLNDETHHVLEDILNFKQDSEVHEAFYHSGIDHPNDLATLNLVTGPTDILTYKEESSGDVKYASRHRMKVHKLIAFVHWTQEHGDSTWDYSTMILDDFDTFRDDGRLKMMSENALTNQGLHTKPPPGASTQSAPPIDERVKNFDKGIKRDAKAYKVISDDKQFDSWNRHTLATAKAQGLGDVLEADYKPKTPDDIVLFKMKQEFLYPVLLEILKTDVGQSLVRNSAYEGDAQSIYTEFCKYSSTSTKATQTASDLIKYLTTFTIDQWKGSCHAFILHWLDQVRIYHTLVEDDEDRLSPLMQLRLLRTSVASNALLHAVETTGDIIKQALRDVPVKRTSKASLSDFESYLVLLKAAAQKYDLQFTSRPRPTKRHANIHQTRFDETLDIDYEIHNLLVDTPPSSQHPVTVNLHRTAWDQLTPEAQARWDEFSKEEKDVIRGIESRQPPHKPPGRNQKGSGPRPPATRTANLHEVSAADFLQSFLHDQSKGSNDRSNDSEPKEDAQQPTRHVNFVGTDSKPPPNAVPDDDPPIVHPADLRNMLANFTKIDDTNYNVNVQKLVNYRVSGYQSNPTVGTTLVDRGGNGTVLGAEWRVIERTTRTVGVTGFDDHQQNDIPICKAGAYCNTSRGPTILIAPQSAFRGIGKSILSSIQMEAYGNSVDEKSERAGGKQCITTLEGYVLPIDIVEGLSYLRTRAYTDKEYDELPHVLLSSDSDWDPTIFDNKISDNQEWFDAQQDILPDNNMMDHPFNEYGTYRHTTDDPEVEVDTHLLNYHTEVKEHFFDTADLEKMSLDDVVDYAVMTVQAEREYDESVADYRRAYGESIDKPERDESGLYYIHETRVKTQPVPDAALEAIRPFLLYANAEIVRKTLENTTQYGRTPQGDRLQQHHKSYNPAINVQRRNEAVATDTVFSDTPAIGGGQTCAQIFVGVDTLLTDVYGVKTTKQFVNTLQDNIRQRGAMSKLISDRAQLEISTRVKDVLRALHISDWQSEPHHQNQNPSERRYGTVKEWTNRTMDRSGAPPKAWLLCMMWVCYILNRTATGSLDFDTPLRRHTGQTTDITNMLRFCFWEEVLFIRHSAKFPSDSTEALGRIVGFSEHVGNDMCYQVYTSDTNKIIHTSRVRKYDAIRSPNLRAKPDSGENDPPSQFVKSRSDEQTGNTTGQGLVVVDPSDLIGRTFLQNVKNDDGTRHRCKIVEAIQTRDAKLKKDPTLLKFICSVNDDEYQDILSYNEILDRIDSQAQNEEQIWNYKRIFAHQGPLRPTDKDWKGSAYNVGLEWETGERTYEPLAMIAADDPVTCAIYARDKGLLQTDGWRRFKRVVKNQKKLSRMLNQAKLRSYRRGPKYMYGVQVPHDHAEAVRLDEKNGNTLYQDAEAVEIQQLKEYDTFHDKGVYSKDRNPTPQGYKMIRLRMIYAVKHDGRRKARLVAGGHLTPEPIDSVYSGVVSLRGLRLIIFLAELNGLEVWATDIGNAYLEAKTAEKVCVIAGPEFGPLQGHLLVIYKALYGLRSSGLRWHEKFAQTLRDMGFVPSKAEQDIWMRRNGDIYEYIAVYVDDLAIGAKDPKAIVDLLVGKYEYKLKGTGEISFHLGCDFWRDENGILCFAPLKYIEKMIDTYERLFGRKPSKKVRSPLEPNDHPELDTSELLNDEGVKIYQSLIGAMQWAVSIGRMDITTAVMTMSGFRIAPRQGHLERCKRIYCYLANFSQATIMVKTEEPDYSALPTKEYDWANSVYGNVKVDDPEGIPEPLGKWVTVTTYVDANLLHDMITGRSVTGILQFLNKTPVDWYSKKQATVESATYGSEFVAARTATDKTFDLVYTLKYLGVRVRPRAHMFGDNDAVVNSASIPQSKLHKRHMALSYHRVREAIASGFLQFHHIPGESNPADIVSKHWAYAKVWQLLRPLLFWARTDKAKSDDKPP
jgi:hypothetical protein